MAREHHLVTGATGFLGSALVLELLDRGDGIVTCLARPRPGQSATGRVRAALRQAARMFDRPGLYDAIDERCRGLDGDLRREARDEDLRPLGTVDRVWHLAALVNFDDAREDDLRVSNVTGTRHAVELARRTGAVDFNYVSTAFVAGKRQGRIPEEPADSTVETVNWYERTKRMGEEIVLGSGLPRVNVFRPSMVIGHSRTMAVANPGTMYGVCRGFVYARGVLTEIVGDVLATRPWRVYGNPEGRHNVIPVDRVAEAAVRIALANTDPDIYHLAGTQAIVLPDLLGAIADAAGVREPEIVTDQGQLSFADQVVADTVAVFQPYALGDKVFEVAKSSKVCGESLLDFPISRDLMARFLRWDLEQALGA
jgi:nucleoside-diphosphate-sugar epimerase